MASFFNVGSLGNIGINPLNTPIGQKIEEATDGYQASENWALFLEICDMINDSEDGARDAVRAIKKRLQQNAGKNYKTVMFTLTLLETCVKNCGRKLHIQVCSKDFVQELIKLIGPKNDPPVIVQEKVLSLIQSWSDAFYNLPECSGVVHAYKELRSKGVEFPMTDLDSMAPIHTPQKHTMEYEKAPLHEKRPDLLSQSPGCSSMSMSPPSPDSPDGSLYVDASQLAKLRSELDVVEGNASVLNEMLNELNPGNESPDDLQLLTELYDICKRMQERIMVLISILPGNELTAELLRVNDTLNNLFLRYSRYEKNRGAKLSQESQPLAPLEKPLIDLSDDADTTGHVTNKVSLLGEKGPSTSATVHQPPKEPVTIKTDPDFDMFAQSRNVSYETSKITGSTYEDNIKPNQITGGLAAATQARTQHSSYSTSQTPPPLQSSGPPSLTHCERDFDEMAAWLGEPVTSLQHDSLTSSEFDRFLAERAAAVEDLPDPRSSSNNKKEGNKTSKDKEFMFAS